MIVHVALLCVAYGAQPRLLIGTGSILVSSTRSLTAQEETKPGRAHFRQSTKPPKHSLVTLSVRGVEDDVARNAWGYENGC